MMKKFNAIILSLVAVTASLLCTRPAYADEGIIRNLWSPPYYSICSINADGQNPSDNVRSDANGDCSGYRQSPYVLPGTSRRRFYYVAIRNAANGTGKTTFREGSFARITFSFSGKEYLTDSINQYIGAVRLMPNAASSAFIPLYAENFQTSNYYQTDSSTDYIYTTTFDVIFYMVGPEYYWYEAYLYMNIFTGGQFDSVNVTNAIFYDDTTHFLVTTNKQLDEIHALIEEIKNKKSDNAGEVLQDQRNEDKRDMNNAQSDASSSGSDSQSDAQNASSSLLSTLSTFIGALTDVSPSSCDLTLDTDYGGSSKFGFGTLNLCALSPPPAFQVISSVVVIGFSIPLVVIALREMLSLIWSFQK